jgi:hypothetical protein
MIMNGKVALHVISGIKVHDRPEPSFIRATFPVASPSSTCVYKVVERELAENLSGRVEDGKKPRGTSSNCLKRMIIRRHGPRSGLCRLLSLSLGR